MTLIRVKPSLIIEEQSANLRTLSFQQSWNRGKSETRNLLSRYQGGDRHLTHMWDEVECYFVRLGTNNVADVGS